MTGFTQAPKSAPSKRHSKVACGSFEVKVNVALRELSGEGGKNELSMVSKRLNATAQSAACASRIARHNRSGVTGMLSRGAIL